MKWASSCFTLFLCSTILSCRAQTAGGNLYSEPHRPQFHYSPKKHWMNDPNGMVFINGTYHLFYQHYPQGTKWGPMHWGHATSADLVHWQEQPIALYPDSLGYIFSGSAVVDKDNTSGLGKEGKVPLVAIFTHHSVEKERAKRTDYQYQSLAYSLDEGKTWTKYAGNPVLPNPGITDFRDPKVRWYEAQKKWVMTLATKDRITFFSSPNLLNWTKESEFGETLGAHGGVWECPDLFPIEHNGKPVWVLLVSINPGGPNGGSATQYFLGGFDGKTFTPMDAEVRWLDWGTDNYAGVTFANVGTRSLFMGWMSNWQYAERVPTTAWRSAITLPRDLQIREVAGKLYVASQPAPELQAIAGSTATVEMVRVKGRVDLGKWFRSDSGLYRLDLGALPVEDFSIVLNNTAGDELVIGYEKKANQYYIDRTKTGEVGFEPGFARVHRAPRISRDKNIRLTLLADAASVELFADDGLTVMTDIFFPRAVLTGLFLQAPEPITVKDLKYSTITSTFNAQAVAVK
jgi:fructan beta-fructosidase